ncbi:hypothetical protein [Anaerohalosphaera lusitana]|nr:hypothetical protein [Anaerohalosphaera lusitana]
MLKNCVLAVLVLVAVFMSGCCPMCVEREDGDAGSCEIRGESTSEKLDNSGIQIDMSFEGSRSELSYFRDK